MQNCQEKKDQDSHQGKVQMPVWRAPQLSRAMRDALRSRYVISRFVYAVQTQLHFLWKGSAFWHNSSSPFQKAF